MPNKTCVICLETVPKRQQFSPCKHHPVHVGCQSQLPSADGVHTKCCVCKQTSVIPQALRARFKPKPKPYNSDIKQCPNCGQYIQWTGEGCPNVTCRCGARLNWHTLKPSYDHIILSVILVIALVSLATLTWCGLIARNDGPCEPDPIEDLVTAHCRVLRAALHESVLKSVRFERNDLIYYRCNL